MLNYCSRRCNNTYQRAHIGECLFIFLWVRCHSLYNFCLSMANPPRVGDGRARACGLKLPPVMERQSGWNPGEEVSGKREALVMGLNQEGYRGHVMNKHPLDQFQGCTLHSGRRGWALCGQPCPPPTLHGNQPQRQSSVCGPLINTSFKSCRTWLAAL